MESVFNIHKYDILVQSNNKLPQKIVRDELVNKSLIRVLGRGGISQVQKSVKWRIILD